MRPDFNREVHCILGLPFDAVSMSDAVQLIQHAASSHLPCFFSTPNLNFLIGCQSDTAFRNSVINSDISIADGMPIVWYAKLLGIPIRERVAGSDLFEQLRTASPSPLSVYFFGGTVGVAETACQRLNAVSSSISCAGFESPGFGSVQEMSSSQTIEKINASGANFLLVSLGAKKGQAWIEFNRARISIPVISHLGAVINFVAGKIDRAPIWVQRSGFEWLWRVKEEPSLWHRYKSDGLVLLGLVVKRIVPYVWFRLWNKPSAQELVTNAIELFDIDGEIILSLCGAWVRSNLQPLRDCISNSVLDGKDVQIDLQHVIYVDSAFIGLLMLLYGDRLRQGNRFFACKSKKQVRQIFKYTCAEFLLDLQ
jgi:N-acetylglucosaminyldiphosphoundecaprenol N-acetyl-beta-D-mannosaminyltransferase